MSLRIAIVTSGRFHVLDLARELAALGYEIAFYSYVPQRRALRFGLPSESHRGLLPFLAHLLGLQRICPPRFKPIITHAIYETLDRLVAKRLKPCDVFIGMSGICVESAKTAKKKYGAKVFIERGSRHILSQKAILDSLAMYAPQADTVPDYAVQRELASYELADVVVVPSRHVLESFLEQGFPRDKLFRNPYGVDLNMFPPTPTPPIDPPTILFVGNWSLRKGCDILVKAWRKLPGVRLIHVGSIGDAPLPQDAGFTHYDAVPQWRLTEIYAKAHVFVLASRNDGFGMVLAQALASGLPLVCTDRTGGEDLRDALKDPQWVIVVPVEDANALAQGIQSALQLARGQRGLRKVLGHDRKKLSWGAYGERYDQFLRACLSGETQEVNFNSC